MKKKSKKIMSFKKEFRTIIFGAAAVLFLVVLLVTVPQSTKGDTGALVPVALRSADLEGTADVAAMDVYGNYAYSVQGSSGKLILTNFGTTTPWYVSNVMIGASIKDIVAQRDFVYLATNKDVGELAVVKVINPSSPVLAGLFNTPGGASGTALAVANSKAYLGTVNNTIAAGREFYILDVANPVYPSLLGSFELGFSVQDIAVNDHYAYVLTNNPNNELVVLDIQNPSSISQVAAYNINGSAIANALAYYNGNIFVVTNDNGIQPDFFVFSHQGSQVQLLGSKNLSSDHKDIAVRGNHAYIANAATNGLSIVDISTPATPTLAATVNTGDIANSVVLEGPMVYMGTGNNTKEIQQINPALPLRIKDINGDGIIRISCLGDSNTFNWVAPRWCDFMRDMIAQTGVSIQTNVPAWFGATVTHNPNGGILDAYGQMPLALQSNPDAIILPFGTNDILLGAGHTPEEIVAAYAEHKANAEAQGISVFIALTPPIQDYINNIMLNDPRIAAVNTLIKQTFSADQIIDFNSTIIQEDFDNSEGHFIYNGHLQRALKAYERLVYSD